MWNVVDFTLFVKKNSKKNKIQEDVPTLSSTQVYDVDRTQLNQQETVEYTVPYVLIAKTMMLPSSPKIFSFSIFDFPILEFFLVRE